MESTFAVEGVIDGGVVQQVDGWEFSLQTLVWAAYMLLRAGLRLWALLHAGVGGFVAVSFLTGIVPYVVLVAWGLWHARRSFSRLESTPG